VSSRCDKGDFAAGAAEEEIHRPFMRQSLGVGKPTPAAAMMHELGREPMMLFWLRMAAQLWNKALSRDSSDWVRIALEENVRMALDGALPLTSRKSLWAFHFLACMDALGLTWREPEGELREIPIPELKKQMKGRWDRWEWKTVDEAATTEWAAQPCAVRAAPVAFSKGFKLFTYKRWFATNWVRKESFTFHLSRRDHVQAVAQFRLGSHWLQIEQGRHAKPRQGRCDRHCIACSGQVEDEVHLLECPLYAGERERAGLPGCPEGGWTDEMVRTCFNGTTQELWTKIADFLTRCKKLKLDQSAS
jgi:hypothetical protein